MIATTIPELLELIESLDGYGIIVEDSELLEKTLNDWNYGQKSEVPGLIYMEDKLSAMAN